MPTILAPRCGSCLHFDEEGGQCLYNPPSLQFFLLPVRTVGGDGMQVRPVSGWPPVNPEARCGKFSAKIEIPLS